MTFEMIDPGKRFLGSRLSTSSEWRWWLVGSSLSLVLAGATIATSIGCSDRSPPAHHIDEQDLAIEMPGSPAATDSLAKSLDPPELIEIENASKAGNAPGTESVVDEQATSAPSANGEASAAMNQPSIQALDAPQVSQLTLIQTGAGAGQQSPAGDDAAEVIATPPGTPEVAAEEIPTPQGERAGMPSESSRRTAAAPKQSEGTQPTPPATAEPRVALIDATDVEAAQPEDYQSWPVPDVALVVTGQQHGYIEPCGCTGLENQKGGVARRMTFMQQLRESGWNLLPLDGGNQVRRFGRQAEIKFQRTAEALTNMGYRAVGFGPDDLRLGIGELIAVAASETADKSMYISANVVLLDPELMPQYKVISTGSMKIGVTSVLDPDAVEVKLSDELSVDSPLEGARAAVESMTSDNAQYKVLLFFGEEEAAKKLVTDVDGFDLVVVAGGYGEPTYRPQAIGEKTQMIVTGNKGMYAGLVGLYANQPMRYARVALTDEFEDAPKMRQLMAEYQNQLRDLGFEGLGLKPIRHPSGNEFVGSETCGECHTTAYEIWEGTPHAEATESLVHPGERSDVPRHFDPECLSCHVTGWNPQNYYPYQSGYLDLDQHAHLTGNGCENCHGPGSAHVAVEQGDVEVEPARRDELRAAMRLPLENARERCMECHDLDNSPDFHEPDAFDDYWAQIEHTGKD